MNVVPGGPAFEAGSGEITVTAGGDPVEVTDLPTGAQVTLEEVQPSNPEGGTYTGVSWDPGNTLTIGKDTTAEIGLENTIELNTGDFSVVKVLDGSGAGLISEDATFTVDYEYEAGRFEAVPVLQLTADGEPPRPPLRCEVQLRGEPDRHQGRPGRVTTPLDRDR